MAGTSLCFLAVCSFFSFPGQNEGDMLNYPSSLEKKSTGKISGVSAGLMALLWLRKSHVFESSHGWGICAVQ